VQCRVCEHFCAIRPGEAGKCGVRRNFDGTLHLVVYGEAIAVPDYEMLDLPPTSQRALARAYEIGKQAGLHYVYVGNVMDEDRESTYCPRCGQKLIQRHWYSVRELWRERGVCPQCGHATAGVWSQSVVGC